MSATFANPGTKVISPIQLAHVVLKTQPSNFKKMVDFYKTFLSANISHENDYISFLRYDDEHHRIAIVAMPDVGPRDPKASGLFHIAFTFNSLTDLALAYLQRKAHGIEPYWSVNHGPTTSVYYRDPDGNDLETQVDNMSMDEANDFMMTPEFAENPIGVDFVPEDLIKRLESGESDESIKKRPKIGPRGIPTFF
ncbi:Glyoxalase/Bleomycin resistance protein/Dihydroxybiphenyl dioxygenase [Acephala macrosclerotiorum]|nr:Glyoxalase/Bleomycin resistance protein/Dihydroxybiphenyl dioxygenase [Acephala macrosclerotiorum]